MRRKHLQTSCVYRQTSFSIPYGSNGVEAKVSFAQVRDVDIPKRCFSIPYGSNGVEALKQRVFYQDSILFQYPLRIEWC